TARTAASYPTADLPPPSLHDALPIFLGATGSIGASTVDLIKRNRGYYRVEALSANRNGTALAKLARDLGARFAAVGDPAAYRVRSEEHTSELQSHLNLVCGLLLEKT